MLFFKKTLLKKVDNLFVNQTNHLPTIIRGVRSSRTSLHEIGLVAYRDSELLPQLRLLVSIHDIT